MPRGSALVLAPHPDDEVLGCGGAIMRHTAANDPVRVIVVTDGAFGRAKDRDAYIRTRQDESRCAAAVLGCQSPEHWLLPDRGLEYGERLIQRILAAIDAQAADLVYAPSWWEMHPDHFALALAAAEAVRRCARPIQLVMYEIGVPLHPNRLLDITDLVDRKQAAIECFESQLAQQRYDRHIAALNTYRTYTLPGTVEAAEAYRLMSQEELRQNPLRLIRPGAYYTQDGRPEATPPPLVSVIVADSRGGEDTDTLDSIALQTYPSIEILTCMEASTTSNAPIWDRFPIRPVAADEAASPARRVNLALDAAGGDFVIVLQDSAVLEPDHISSLMRALLDAPDQGCAYAGTGFDRLDLWSGTHPPLSCFVIARRLLSDGCRFDESLPSGHDWDLLIQLSQMTEFLPIDCTTLRLPAKPAQPIASHVPSASSSIEAAMAKWQRRWSPSELLEIIRRRDSLKAIAEQQAASLRVELAAQTAATEQERSRADDLARQLAEAAAQAATAERLRQENAALQHSTSWRLTKPLRALVTRLRRINRSSAKNAADSRAPRLQR